MVGGHVRLDRGHDLLVAVPASHVPALALDELGHDHPASAGIHAYAPCLGETLGGSWAHPRCAAVGDTARGRGGAVAPHGVDWVRLNLAPGDYIAVCLVPDAEAQGAPHAALGMVRGFSVR